MEYKNRVGGSEVPNEKELKMVRSRMRGVWRMLCLHQTRLDVVQSRNGEGGELCSPEPGRWPEVL